MKRGKHYRGAEKKQRHSVKRNLMLAAVSLLLVLLTFVTATVSWIEDVSQVEFNTNEDSQQTPVHIGSKILKSDAAMKSDPATPDIDLNQYFMKSGDMHLSPCYGDGENFYFPIEGGNATGYRVGTKDDANVNYLSATFRVQSHAANTVYWFEKTGNTDFVTFKDNGSSLGSANLAQYLRISVTVDGATNVYALNGSGEFTTIVNNATSAVSGRRVEQYTYYDETFNDSAPEKYYKNAVNVTNKFNQGAGENLNGNTLFTVNQYDSANKNTVKTVTVKVWLECNNYTSDADLSSINFNIVSSWAKNRRVYVKDATVHETGYIGANWLSSYNATLFFALKDDMNGKHWQMTRVEGTNYYYADIPAVYNNADAVFFRCSDGGWNSGTTTSFTYNNTTVNGWNYWETVFPNTFHSEVYSVYSTGYATWDDVTNYVYFVNSCKTQAGFDNRTPRAYMWDSHSVIDETDIDKKVVQNAKWTGIEMTKLGYQVTNKNITMDLYVFHYNSVYDRIIFNDNYGNRTDRYQYQTQDLWLSNISSSGQQNKPYFDMATLSWYSSVDDLPNYSNVFLKSNMRGGNYNMETRFAYDKNGNGNVKYCYVYIKSDRTSDNHNHYTFTIWDGDTSTEYKCHKDSGNLTLGQPYALGTGNDWNKSFSLYDIDRGVYKFTYEPGSSIKVECIENFQN